MLDASASLPRAVSARWRVALIALTASTWLFGATAVAQEECALADALRIAGAIEEAARRYGGLLKLDPVPECAVTGMAALETARSAKAANGAFEAVRQLSRAGFHPEASAALQKAITDHPGHAVPDDLVDLYVERPDWIRFYDAYVAPALVYGLLAVAAAVAAGLIIFAMWGRFDQRERWYFQVGDLAAADAALGKALGAGLNDAIWRLERDGGGDRLWRGEAGAQDFNALTTLAEAVPQLKAVSLAQSLVERVFPRRTIALTGAVHPPSDRLGVGMTLVLTGKGGGSDFVDSVTLWEHDFEDWPHKTAEKDVSGYYRLNLLGAVWAEYAIDRRLRVRSPGKPQVKLATKDWRSYALYASGADWDARGEIERARRQYLAAIEADPANHLALLNLANDERYLADPTDKNAYKAMADRVIERLEAIGRARGDPPKEPEKRDPSHFRAAYVRVAIDVERASVTDEAVDENDVKRAAVLVHDTLAALQALSREEPELSRPERELRRFLIKNKGVIVAGLAVVLAKHNPGAVTPDKTLGDEPLRKWLYTALPKERREAPATAEPATAVAPVGGAKAEQPKAASKLEAFDKAKFGHDAVASYLLAPECGSLSRGTYYNLAIYESVLDGASMGLAGRESQALAHFKRSASGHGARFATWARRDPTLAPLLAGDHADAVETILKACERDDLKPYVAAPAPPTPESTPAQHQVDLTLRLPPPRRV